MHHLPRNNTTRVANSPPTNIQVNNSFARNLRQPKATEKKIKKFHKAQVWRPTSPKYGDGDVLICIPTPFMTKPSFKAVMVMIPSEFHS